VYVFAQPVTGVGHSLQMVLALVKNCNANCIEPDLDGLTPMYAAASQSHTETVLALLRDCNVDPFETLKKAVYLNNMDVVGILEKRCGVDYSIVDNIEREKWKKIKEHNETLKKEKYECPVCFLEKNDIIAFDPCGHRVCTSCWEDLTKRNIKKCPKCRAEIKKGISQEKITGGLYLYSRFFVDIPGVTRCLV
jgi:PHP family Zn ribbon phosphoesterase